MPHQTSEALLKEHTAFLEGGASINVAACDASGRPSLSRATGCRVSRAEGTLTVFLSRPQSEALLRDIENLGRVAVVFSDPPTHRTLQVKGEGATVATAEAGDVECARAYVRAFSEVLRPLGFKPELVEAMLACAPSDLALIRFKPTHFFDQTPGPQAGAPLNGGA